MNAQWRMMALSFETFNRSYLRHFIRSSSENPRDESRGHKIIRAAGTSAPAPFKNAIGMTDMVTSDFNPRGRAAGTSAYQSHLRFSNRSNF